ncbi:exopolysaccharide biosynthesis polyprenyl glycosylphosphotransferase [Acidocella sp.]|jgi:Undecaprenyl-phosphate glucose phosphotransferase|uniref:exopolysaccharide biosynthesis polyprenyl glycosylphosphotransferase n=1 Tax=Acidocella sp. TaxID=50710 RepID=UPI002F3FD681
MLQITASASIARRATWTTGIFVRLLEAGILLAEAMMVLASGAIAKALMTHAVADLPNPIAMAAAYVFLVVAGDATARPPIRRRRGEALRILGAVFVVALLLSGHIFAGAPGLAVWALIAASAISAWRWFSLRLSQTIPPDAWPARRVAFIGNSAAAARLLSELETDRRQNIQPVGFFDDRAARLGPLHERLPYLGTIDGLVSYIHDQELSDVYMALPWAAGERISVLIDRLRFLPLTVRLVPDATPPALQLGYANQSQGVVMPTLMVPPFSFAGACAKRSLDLIVSLGLLIPLSLFFLLVAAAIRLDSPGPVFFLQRRTGQFGRSFNIYKFRSLHEARADSGAESLVSKSDARVTRVGKYLRKYSIDELPQLINVLLGDMSLVGPRPHAPRAKADRRIYAEVMADYMLRYRVKPGMTGWAQVNGWRGNTDTEEKLRKRVEFDFEYIKNWSFLRDLQILVMTVPSALFPPQDNV